MRDQQGLVNAHLVDSIQGMREVVAFGRGETRAREARVNSERLGVVQLAYSRFIGAIAGGTETLVALGAFSVLVTGASLVASGVITRWQLPLILVLSFCPVVVCFWPRRTSVSLAE